MTCDVQITKGIGECRNRDTHKLEPRSQQNGDGILKKACENATNVYSFPKEELGGSFHVTIELSETASNPKITEEVQRVLKEEFLKNFITGSGHRGNFALSSPAHFEKGDEPK